MAILKNSDLEDYERLCEKFDSECAGGCIEAEQQHIPISIARGFARYDSGMDGQFVDVFNRADEAMYQNKRKMKLSRKPACF